MEVKYFTLEDCPDKLVGKTVFVRVDTNTTLINGQIRKNERVIRAARTIRRIAERGAKVIVGTHNGRMGDVSFVTLGQLKGQLSDKIIGEIKYIGNTYDPKRDTLNDEALRAIRSLSNGEALLLENLRYLDGETKNLSPEEHAKTAFIRTLIDDCGVQYFFNDAFSTSHRSHRSIVGFEELPNIAGLVMDSELSSVNEILEHLNNHQNGRLNVYVLGGVKIQDYFDLVENSLKEGKVEKVLTGGIFANLCLFVAGHDLGQENMKRLTKNDSKGKSIWDFADRAKKLLADYPDAFELPSDVAIEQDGRRVEYKIEKFTPELGKNHAVLDIGRETTMRYSDIIRRAQMVFVKGPVGFFESDNFNYGSREILNTLTTTNAYSVMGGGDTSVMLNEFRVNRNEISYISLAGGALLDFLAGKTLPGVESLQRSYRRYEGILPS